MSSGNTYSDELKRVMRQMPYPVTIVTAANGSEQRGITIGSFTSLSMDPPLISFNVENESQMNSLLKQTDHFVVNVPHQGQENLCTRFSIPDLDGTDQFSGLSYTLNSYGIPVLDDIVASIFCKQYEQILTGDHTIYVGEVTKISIMKEDAAILYLNGSYHQLGSPGLNE